MMFNTNLTLGRPLLPLGFDAGDANLYRYVNDNPTNATDPHGLEELFQFKKEEFIKGVRGAFAYPFRLVPKKVPNEKGFILVEVGVAVNDLNEKNDALLPQGNSRAFFAAIPVINKMPATYKIDKSFFRKNDLTVPGDLSASLWFYLPKQPEGSTGALYWSYVVNYVKGDIPMEFKDNDKAMIPALRCYDSKANYKVIKDLDKQKTLLFRVSFNVSWKNGGKTIANVREQKQ
jgi:hypothetical protein